MQLLLDNPAVQGMLLLVVMALGGLVLAWLKKLTDKMNAVLVTTEQTTDKVNAVLVTTEKTEALVNSQATEWKAQIRSLEALVEVGRVAAVLAAEEAARKAVTAAVTLAETAAKELVQQDTLRMALQAQSSPGPAVSAAPPSHPSPVTITTPLVRVETTELRGTVPGTSSHTPGAGGETTDVALPPTKPAP